MSYEVSNAAEGCLCQGRTTVEAPSMIAPRTSALTLITGDQSLGDALTRAQQAERTKKEASRRVHEERLRIAREVHDIVAHSIATINVQAGTAVHVLDKRPEQARAALLAIKQASADAIRELRTTVGTMRGAGSSPSEARLARLPELVSMAQSFGLDADLRISGEPCDLPSSIDLAAYRIFQESITNVIRHAQASRVALSLTYGPDRIELRVEDDGRGHDCEETVVEGNGTRGMRERASLLGGDFSAGPLSSGGFIVQAQLPYDD